MKNQTAVQWLMEVLPSADRKLTIAEAVEKAKEMEKQQIIDSYINGMHKGQELYFGEHKIKLDVNSLSYSCEIVDQYYKKTYTDETA